MATPNWDILHTRFATSIRDEVVLASDNGQELSVTDRDAYLMYSYNQYVRLLQLYSPEQVKLILSELFSITSITAIAGVANLPDDFGFLISLDCDTAGVVITAIPPDKFKRYAQSTTLQNPFTGTYVGYCLVGSTVQFLPTTVAYAFSVSYLVAPKNITQGGSDDILIKSEHWDTIIAFAKVAYYRDKQEFQVAEAFRADAVKNSPFPIG